MLSKTKLILLTSTTLVFQPQEVNASNKDGKCRILSLRGGGVHGAWESGVINGIVNNMADEDIEYDFFAGVSIGAINASIMATFAKGQEKEAAKDLMTLY